MKQYKLFLILLIGWFITFPSFAQELPEAELQRTLELFPNVRTGKLPNGLTYYIMQNKKPENRMELRLAVNAGSTSEDHEQEGLAHFVEHMAFNGTAHFKKNELVDYLESIGTKFGPHLNAYTSFDETVYMMQVPTDSAQQFNKSFQILEDWAHGLSFDSVEVNKERGVVIEEWRLGQGAFERMRNEYWPVLFKGSRYEQRLPIGKKEVLEKAPVAKLKSFYKDWYRPNLMAVIAVGDFNVDEVEQKIIAHFSKLVNPAKPRPLTNWVIAESPTVEIAKAKDKEAPYTMIQIIYKHPTEDVVTEADYRKQLMYRLYNNMISSRLEEIINKPDAPFNYAASYYGDFVRYKNAYASFAIVKENSIMRGLTALVDENEKVIKFGFSPGELERQKKQMLRDLERQQNEQDKTESSRIIPKIVSYYLEKQPFIGPAKELELYNKYIGSIRIDEFNQLARKWISKDGSNCTVIIQSPAKPGIKIPTDDEIRDMILTVGKRDIKPYDDTENNTPFIAKMPVPGKINAEKRDKETGVVEYTLSNGATVAFKQTEFKNDEVQLRALSWGGSSLYPLSDDVTASEASGIISNSGLGTYTNADLDKYLKGKIANVRPYISETSEGLYGSASPQDLETMMQMIYLYFTAPRKDTSGYKSYMDQQKAFVENRSLDPESAYDDTIEVTMSNYHPRRRPWTPALLKEVNHNRAYEIFKDRFSDASGFNFMFVGNIQEDIFKKLCTDYLAALPSTNKSETWQDIGITTPKGKIKKTVKKGTEPKSTVTMKFTGNATWTAKENMDMKVLLKLMSIRLREVLREENSGTYGVSCYGGLNRIPKQDFAVTIQFGCAPENIDRLTKAALKVIEEVQATGCDEKNLVKVKETFRREREVNLKENNWWMNTISQHYAMKDPYPSQKEFDAYFENLKSEDFTAAAKKYFDKENYAYFTWVPETN